MTTVLATYLLNALWQVPVIFLVALLLARLARPLGPAFGHRLWVFTLLVQVTLPALPASLLQMFASLFSGLQKSPDTHITINSTATVLSGTLGLPRILLVTLAVFYFVSLIFFAARFLSRIVRTSRLNRRATALPRSAELDTIWIQLAGRFRLSHAQLATSPDISGPATIGIYRQQLLLPPHFARTVLPEDLHAALAHECAHIQRHDFALNLFYELLSLPLAFHPILHLTLTRLAGTREILCDHLAAQALEGPNRYARSLLRLAAALLPSAQTLPPHALGIFQAQRPTLETRIMTLTSKLPATRRTQRIALVALCLVVALGTTTSAVALRLNVAVPALAQQGSTQSGSAPTLVSGSIMAGQVRSKVVPIYPQEAKQAHITGAVVLRAVIGKDGTMQSLTVISGAPELQSSAITAVRQWIYEPFLLNGIPTDVETTITVTYSML